MIGNLRKFSKARVVIVNGNVVKANDPSQILVVKG